MKILNKIGPNIAPWDTQRMISDHQRETYLYSVSFFADNFESILGHYHLIGNIINLAITSS